jgi:TM2 domain-containing membrane protein YozV
MQQWYQCPRCNSPVSYGTQYCNNCGQPLNWQQPQPPPQQPIQTPHYQQQYQPPQQQTSYSQQDTMVSPKSRLAATLLAYFLGIFGAHRFYIGKVGSGLAMLFTLGGLGIWAIIDFIFAVAGSLRDSNDLPIKKW